jgi:hypothetical protein
MAKLETELRIIEQIALSSIPISVFEISKSFGESSYSHVHKTCKELIEDGVLESITSTNRRNAPKKILRLSMRGFCLFVAEGALFKKVGSGEQYSDGELKKIHTFIELWENLHPGVGIFGILLKKYQKDWDYQINEAFKRATGKAFIFDMIMSEKKETDISFKDDNPQRWAYMYHYWETLIEEFLDLPRNTDIPLDDIIETFRDNSGDHLDTMMSRLEDQMEMRKMAAEEILRCYKKYF